VGPVVEVERPDDPRLADYAGLTDMQLRMRVEPEHGLFIAEGELVIRRALRAGYRLRSLLLTRHRLGTIADALERDGAADAPVYVGSLATLQAVTGFHVHRGALAAVDRRPVPTWQEVARAARRLVVLEDVNNHTNLGALFRSAAGLGMDGVLLSPGCVDPLYRRSVRVSMGEVFALPYADAEPWPGVLEALVADGWRTLALTPDPAAPALGESAFGHDERVAVLLGAEGPGLSPAALAATEPVRIPMAAGVDSLNVAAAAAIAFWEVGRR
jgi:tRNA G18 (ribose-2'-O)-methylase SpoU